ncbi:hypothetical protein QYF36_009215 [Acer negundo]|nr:hypothetical protein QYF36_009215 [Acer negundo]
MCNSVALFHLKTRRLVALWQRKLQTQFSETPVQKDGEPCLETEEATGVEKDTEDTSKKRRKKESKLTVKSALSAAFAKYADKIGKKSNNSPGKKGGETSATKSGDEYGSIGEGATGRCNGNGSECIVHPRQVKQMLSVHYSSRRMHIHIEGGSSIFLCLEFHLLT